MGSALNNTGQAIEIIAITLAHLSGDQSRSLGLHELVQRPHIALVTRDEREPWPHVPHRPERRPRSRLTGGSTILPGTGLRPERLVARIRRSGSARKHGLFGIASRHALITLACAVALAGPRSRCRSLRLARPRCDLRRARPGRIALGSGACWVFVHVARFGAVHVRLLSRLVSAGASISQALILVGAGLGLVLLWRGRGRGRLRFGASASLILLPPLRSCGSSTAVSGWPVVETRDWGGLMLTVFLSRLCRPDLGAARRSFSRSAGNPAFRSSA